MSELSENVLDPGDKSGIRLFLYRYPRTSNREGNRPRKPVLLLHGASANHLTFIGSDGGLAKYLADDFDPWLLNWRGSGLVVDRNEDALRSNRRAWNFNRAAQYDVPLAIDAIRDRIREEAGRAEVPKIAALGFCMGGAILAESIARGWVTANEVDVVVLMTLGLFYEAPIDGRLKCEDRTLERLARLPKDEFVAVDSRVDDSTCRLRPWPAELEKMYSEWPAALKSHAGLPEGADRPAFDRANHICNRISFMYGMPYHHGNLIKNIHGPSEGRPILPELFGAIPLHMFIHGARNLRRGRATVYERNAGRDDEIVSDQARERFWSLEKLTLMTGTLNRLWHRDSIDRMYEWLTRGSTDSLHKVKKEILPGYGHQDLLWGQSSSSDVFRKIKDGFAVPAGKSHDRLESSSSASRQRLASHGMPSREAATSPRL